MILSANRLRARLDQTNVAVAHAARSQRFELPNSRIRVSCASMASFRPDGKLYDGRGIEVDVEVRPGAPFFLRGGRDDALEVALEYLRHQ